jgi:hypothetical protein
MTSCDSSANSPIRVEDPQVAIRTTPLTTTLGFDRVLRDWRHATRTRRRRGRGRTPPPARNATSPPAAPAAPGLFGQATGVLISPERIAAPRAFIASRLAAWRSAEGVILPGHWTSLLTDAAATKTARALVAARHGRAGAALLRPGERAGRGPAPVVIR